MRKAKRKISTLLILCMFVSMLPASVAADNSDWLAASAEPAAEPPAAAENGSVDGSRLSGSEDFIALREDELDVSTASDVPGPVTLSEETEPFRSWEGLSYRFDKDTKTLTITGGGRAIPTFDDENVPWKSYKQEIVAIKINDANIPSTEASTFSGYSLLSSIEVPGKWKYSKGELNILANVDNASLAVLNELVTKVVIEANVTGITANAFAGMKNLTDSGDKRTPVVFYKGKVTAWPSVGNDADAKGLKVDDRYLLVSCLSNNGNATDLIGVCGRLKTAGTETFVTFRFDGDTQIMTISGEGTMSDFSSLTMPWYSVRGQIKALVFGANVTGIGTYAFYYCTELRDVTIPQQIVSIGSSAFQNCTNLAVLNISNEGGDLVIKDYAFYLCKSLENIGPPTTGQNAKMGFPTRVKKIGEAAFRSSGLVYKPGGTAGHIYYEGTSAEWKAINGEGGSPDIRDGKLLTGANQDENTYAIVHCLESAGTAKLYHSLTFVKGASDATGTAPVLTNDAKLSGIVENAIDNGKVAEDTTLKLPAECGFTRTGYKFNGWLCNADNQVYKVNDTFIMPAKDVTFTAQWTPNTPTQGSPIDVIIEKLTKANWEVPQDAASSKTELIAWLYKETGGTNECTVRNMLNEALKDTGITASYRIQIQYFSPAVMGISNMTKGQNGQFTFDLHLTFKQGTDVFIATASIKNGVITAIEYDKEKDKKYTVTFNLDGGTIPNPNAPNYGYTIVTDTTVKWTEMRPGQNFLLPALKHKTKEFDRWVCTLTDGGDDSFVKNFTYRTGAQFMMRQANVIFTPQWKGDTTSSNVSTLQASLSDWEPLVSSELAAGKKASVTLKTAPVDTNSPEAARIKAASLEDNITFIDLTLSKTVDGETSAITDTNGTLVAVTIPFDGKNAENVKVYRDHDGEVDVLTEGGSGERIAVANDSLTIYAGKFSVYAIAFDRKAASSSASGSGAGSSGGSGGSSGGSGGSSSKPSIINHGTPTSNPATDSSVPNGNVPSKKRFNDVPPDAWYYEAANWAYDQKIAKGEGGRRLNPNKLCTRAEMLTFLWRALGSPEPSGTGKTFTDVSSGSYYAKAVQWAAGQKIVKGEGGKRFNPDAPVTRGEAITLLYRAIGVPAAASTRFKDVPESAYYAEAVEWAVSRDIAKGMGSRSFSPASPCTRAQVLTFLYRSQF